MDWSHVDYLWIIVIFLSAVFSLILTAPIHGFLQICSNEETNSSTYILDGLKVVHFKQNIDFESKYSIFPQALSIRWRRK